MDRVLKRFFDGLSGRFRMPALMLCVILQRTPIINTIVERQFGLGPNLVHLFKWITGAGVVVGSVNSVTGATASVQLLPGFDNTHGTLGEPFRISFASSSYVVGSYKLGAAAPPGLSLSPNVKEFGVGTVEGIPSRAGVYNMDIFAYEEDNLTGDSTLLALTIYILEKGPTITDHPNSVSLQWGSALSLSVSVENTTGVTYQWQKNGQDILGTTDASYDVSSVTSLDAGLYQVVVGKDGETKVSDLASISVMASGIEMWKEQEFEDPFGQMADPLSDPDIDGFNNLFEYSIGSDPEKSTTQQIPSIESEDSFMGEFVVYKFPKNPNASDLTVSAEFSDGLSPANWTPIFDLLNGIRVIETVSELKIKVPKDTTCFIRFRVLGPAIN